MSTIVAVHARKIMDQHSALMVETEVELASGAIGRAAVPIESLDAGQEATLKKAVSGERALKAITNIETIIAPLLIGLDALDQIAIDRIMLDLDATEDKTNLGPDSILCVSLAVARAAAEFLYLPLYRYIGGVNAKQLPVPMISIFGNDWNNSESTGSFDFMIMPVGASSWSEALRMCAEVSYSLKAVLKNSGRYSTVFDKNIISAAPGTNEEALSCIVQAIERAGYQTGADVALAIDIAADSCYDGETGLYQLVGENRLFTSQELIDYYDGLVQHYPIVSIERGMSNTDVLGWQYLTARLGEKVQLIDDFINDQRLRQSIRLKAANAVLIRLNRIGSLTETLDCIDMAKRAGWAIILSYLESETANTAIADITVGANAGQIKISTPSDVYGREKYSQLLLIEKDLDSVACYKGREVLHNN